MSYLSFLLLKFYQKKGFLETPLFYIAPLPLKTTHMVFRMILKSLPMVHFVIYSRSSLTTSSKSVISDLPLTCQRPVIPGLIVSRAL